MKKAQWLLKTSVCPIYLVASEKALEGIFWKKQDVPMSPSLVSARPEVKILAVAARQLEEYFKGKRTSFELPLEATGTPFQKKVWHALSRIPYGQTRSYRDIARSIKNPKAVRAVGTANGRNPLSIIVPCHRVIAASGKLGGYGGGLGVKTKLLRLEGCNVR